MRKLPICSLYIAATLSFAAVFLVSGPARADNSAAAEATFEQGREHMEAGRFQEACKSFALSEKLDSSVGTLLNLGECNAKLGKTASAWAAFKKAAVRAGGEGQARRRDYARDRALALKSKLTKLEIHVAGPVPSGFKLLRSGLDVTLLVGVTLPIDPGPYLFEASAPNLPSWRKTLDVVGEGQVVIITIPQLGSAAALPPKPEQQVNSASAKSTAKLPGSKSKIDKKHSANSPSKFTEAFPPPRPVRGSVGFSAGVSQVSTEKFEHDFRPAFGVSGSWRIWHGKWALDVGAIATLFQAQWIRAQDKEIDSMNVGSLLANLSFSRAVSRRWRVGGQLGLGIRVFPKLDKSRMSPLFDEGVEATGMIASFGMRIALGLEFAATETISVYFNPLVLEGSTKREFSEGTLKALDVKKLEVGVGYQF